MPRPGFPPPRKVIHIFHTVFHKCYVNAKNRIIHFLIYIIFVKRSFFEMMHKLGFLQDEHRRPSKILSFHHRSRSL